MENATIKLEGLSCDNCRRKIEKNISELEGVKSIKVSLENSEANVEFDGNELNLNDIKDEINDLGYKAK